MAMHTRRSLFLLEKVLVLIQSWSTKEKASVFTMTISFRCKDNDEFYNIDQWLSQFCTASRNRNANLLLLLLLFSFSSVERLWIPASSSNLETSSDIHRISKKNWISRTNIFVRKTKRFLLFLFKEHKQYCNCCIMPDGAARYKIKLYIFQNLII